MNANDEYQDHPLSEQPPNPYQNKPVAWMSNGKEFYVQKNYCPDFIPLYTHPTDAQINKYKQALESIANEQVELSHDKIKWQNEDHIKWAKDALK
jgi:hypothetical protein